MIPLRIKIVKSTLVSLLNVLRTPRVGPTQIGENNPIQKLKETLPNADKEERNLPIT